MLNESHTFSPYASETFIAAPANPVQDERMTFGDNLQRLMKEAQVNKSELARRLGVTPQAVGQWCNARTKPKNLDRLGKIADALGVGASEIVAFEGGILEAVRPALPAKSKGAVRIIAISEVAVVASAGPGAADVDENTEHAVVATWEVPVDYLVGHARSASAVRIIRVAGDSMEPEYPSGDRVLVDTSHKFPSPPGVYVLWDGFGLVLKRLEVLQGTEPPIVRISSANPAYPAYERPAEGLAINGRVVGKWTWK
jgi:transcriptional regulator with XRE-family HTH domain